LTKTHEHRSSGRTALALAAGIFLVAVIIRVGAGDPKVTPDGQQYRRIADNILLHGCYSDSPPQLGECRPTWSNQPPGYPAFVAVAKLFGAGSPGALVLVQSVVFGAAAAYLFLSGWIALPSRWWAVAVALMCAASPLTAGWSRWILTETLGASATLWVIAECIRSLSEQRLRTVWLALAVACGLMIRWDLVWLVFPVLLVAFRLRRSPGTQLQAGLVLAAVAFPVALLIARAALVGLPLIPGAHNVGPDQDPPGVTTFWKVASTTQSATSELMYRIWSREYSAIAQTFDHDSITPRIDPATLRPVLEVLSAVPDGQPVPPEIDIKFASLAAAAVAEAGVWYWPEIWSARAIAIWSRQDVLTRSGWPTDREPLIQPYRLTLLTLVIVAPFFAARTSWQRTLAGGILVLVLARTMFLVILNGLETRYLTPMIPAMEIVAVLLVCRAVSSLRPNRNDERKIRDA
jgi:hypothetical protein